MAKERLGKNTASMLEMKATVLTRSFRVSSRTRSGTVCCPIRTRTLWSCRTADCTVPWSGSGVAARARPFARMCSSSSHTKTCAENRETLYVEETKEQIMRLCSTYNYRLRVK